MLKWESRLQESIRKNVLWWAFAAVLLLGAFIRYTLLPLMVADMEFFYIPWFNELRDGGVVTLFADNLGFNYSAPHVFLWLLMGKLFPSMDAITACKLLMLVFEAAMIVFALLIVRELLPKERRAPRLFAAFTLLWLNPLLLLSAAGWGQTDVTYAACSMLAVWLLLKDRPAWAMASFGLALAFKLQAIFLLPLLLIVYFCREKKFSLLWFLLIPAVWIVLGVPMAAFGQSPLYSVTAYLGQSESFSDMSTFNYPNLFALLGDVTSQNQTIRGMMQRYGIVLAIGALGCMAAWLMYKRVRLSNRALLLLGSWCVLACVFFLPRMHERYGLVGEMLLLLWAIVLWKPRGFAYALLGALPVVSAYCKYMFKNPIFPLQLGGAINLLVLVLLTLEVAREVRGAVASAPREMRLRA